MRPPPQEDELLPGPDAAVLAIKGVFRPEAAQGLEETYELHLGDEVIQVRVKDDAVEAKQGPIEHPDATIHTTDMKSYVALLRHQTSPEEALSKGLVRIEGDAGALGRFLDLFRLPRIPVEVDVRSRFFSFREALISGNFREGPLPEARLPRITQLVEKRIPPSGLPGMSSAAAQGWTFLVCTTEGMRCHDGHKGTQLRTTPRDLSLEELVSCMRTSEDTSSRDLLMKRSMSSPSRTD